MKSLETITTVYSYRFPEVRRIISEITNPFPHEVFLKATEPPGYLDDFHEPVINKIIDFYSEYVSELSNFGFRYPLAGSEEGIREVMTLLQSQGINQIYVLRGEYEGYKAVGETRNIETIELSPETNPKDIEPGYWFISNPSARDGNIIPNEFIQEICEAGHKVFYDLAYLGSTKKHEFDLSHENIFAAVISFSKPYGMFYDRLGFAFSREPIPSLYGNKWFKNILNLMIAERLVTELKPNTLFDKYRSIQEEIIAGINNDFGLKIKPSDALLLGYMHEGDTVNLNPEQLSMIRRFRRGSGYRFCLTPYYVKQEQTK